LPEKYQGVEVDEVREMIGTMKINQVNKGAIYTLKGSSKLFWSLLISRELSLKKAMV
jgi:hypothetical protein